MTPQEQKAFDQMREALEKIVEKDFFPGAWTDVYERIAEKARAALTAAKEVQAQVVTEGGNHLPPTPQAQARVEPQPLEDLTGVRACCGEYDKCYRPCTPRGRWLAQQDTPQAQHLTDAEVIKVSGKFASKNMNAQMHYVGFAAAIETAFCSKNGIHLGD